MITANSNMPALTPPAKQGGNAYDMASGLMGGAANVYDDISQGGILQNINSYMNPFYEQVIGSTFDRMDINRDKTMNMIGDQAEAAGAFGSGRHGLMEGEFLGQDQLNRGQLASGLMAQNFGQASNAARSDMFGAAQGATQLGNQYFNVGNQIAGNQMQAGGMQQQLMQAILSGGVDQYSQMMQQPYQVIDLFNALGSSDPRNTAVTQTQQSTPGLFDYLSLAAGLGSAAMMGPKGA